MIVRLVDIGQPTERVVVEDAQETEEVPPEIVAEWRTNPSRFVTVDGDRITVGTDDEGDGVVTYEIVDDGTMKPYRTGMMRRVL